MSRIRKTAATVSLLNGAWGIVVGVFWTRVFGAPPWQNETSLTPGGISIDIAILVVGVFLVLDSAVCFWGISAAYYVSALLSVVMPVFVPGGIQLGDLFLASSLFAVATVVLDALAANSRDYILERDHPMNLPVFG